MCGIFGWSGKSPKKFSKDKLNILGIANQTRGVHSCGVAVDGEIKIGIDTFKLFTEFAIENIYNSPNIIPTVLGHTRQATYGKHTLENAHPFGFGNKNGNFEFIGEHNGTLINHTELATKYNISLTDEFIDDKNNKATRTKIDSEILLEIIYKTKNIKVLNEYIGAAALVWTFIEEPNVVYCYHGKSLLTNSAITTTEERPLFYFQETRNSLYFSSLEDPLKMISDGKTDDIHKFDCNVVYQITDGNVSKAKKYIIKREKMTQKASMYTTDYWKEWNNVNDSYARHNKKVSKANKKRRNLNNTMVIPINDTNIYHETPRFSPKEIGGRPYFNKLAWWRTGHRLDGVFAVIPNYGLYNLNVWKRPNTSMKNDINTAICKIVNSDFDNETGLFRTINRTNNIPFAEIKDIPVVFIYNGIMIKTLKDYEVCLHLHGTKSQFNWSALSHCSVHPVTSNTALNSSTTQSILKDGKLFTGYYSSANTFRIYNISNGNLMSTEDISLPPDYYIKNKTYNSQTKLNLIEVDLDDKSCSASENNIIISKIENRETLILDTIDQIFEQPLTGLMLGKMQLEKYTSSKKAKDAILTIDAIMEFAEELID